MNQLNDGMARECVSSRADVSVPVLEEHYDQRDEERKAEARLEYLKNTVPRYSDDTEWSWTASTREEHTQETDEESDQQASLEDFDSSTRSPAVGQVMLTLPIIALILSMPYLTPRTTKLEQKFRQ